MASNNTTECLVNCKVGITVLTKSPETEPLEERLEKDGVKQMIRDKMEKNYNVKFCQENENNSITQGTISQEQSGEPIRDIFVAGQDIATESIKEFTKYLLKRDYLNVATFDGSNDADVGVIVIPETHIPKKPRIVEPKIEDLIIENHPGDNVLKVAFLIQSKI